ncbi:unnamed protein product [Cyclocybe aegerita]|uniref:JmjC domain-containing protein n=1 Tax=Cyclocybe aegerita TaxID=1973307 RepID=A0A8S0WUW8_CYCAE|nr:unnamed protein product [Cyclocybe aegerita]
MHQALFHTFLHHDTDGFGMWMQVLLGYKLWAFVKHCNLDGCKMFQEYRDTAIDYSNQTRVPHGYYGMESNHFVITAGPGDLIIQPTGVFHEVYTPVPSITLGSHFYRQYTAAPALDPDVLMAIEDAAAKRKSGKEYSVTTARAKSLANNIVQGLGLPQHARRGKKAKAQDEEDYLFDDGQWSDPGDVVDLGPILWP